MMVSSRGGDPVGRSLHNDGHVPATAGWGARPHLPAPGGYPVTTQPNDPLTVPTLSCERGPYRGQRLLDLVVVALVAVPVLSVGVVCALAIKATSRGPVFFRQQRVGLGGRRFEVVKFRTMLMGDNPLIPDASRITLAGRLLRRLSLDELPQLLNVVAGDMSVVGPRPTLAYQVERYDHRQMGRLCVRPGLTGLAQVRGRNALSWAQRIDFDLEYIQTRSLWLDLRIIAATPGQLLGGSGVEGHDPNDPLTRTDGPPTGPDARLPPATDNAVKRHDIGR
jgi:lipopolysaccharide/colanic/teichoic acid biosynthesis glycosyltransferase